MPRLSGKLVRHARRVSPFLPPLLPANRDINRALLELKWIKEELPRRSWVSAVNRRLELEPLQYILGSQPFGDLSIICRNGVLIPRWETEEWCTKLGNLLSEKEFTSLDIVDACTGSGCVPILLGHKLVTKSASTKICGFDVSVEAITLAQDNLTLYKSSHMDSSCEVSFQRGDITDLSLVPKLHIQNITLVTANPPYIPLQDYRKSVLRNGVERSVRLHEPELALIGSTEPYQQLIKNLVIPSGAEGFVFEVGYFNQIQTVCQSLDENWVVGYMNDSANRVRCAVGWKLNTDFEILARLCDKVLLK
ncbi:hypothetical protein CANMA_001351 [Candida margitis]|uniref:uncharacterized protein n=1 Tax=Candida margitis TaxID=1775924 RepID=UPI002227A287|nr:uncharacterized protein CANMA_001351 [Candida margitis]KAI5969688.1 hypothetical protein CANMA_001351 [Candida margitis]